MTTCPTTPPRPCTCPPPPEDRPPEFCRRCGACVIGGDGLTLHLAHHAGPGYDRVDLCESCGSVFRQTFLRRPSPKGAPLRARIARVQEVGTVGRGGAFAALFTEAEL
jgi:hypothetical protein